MRQRRFNRRSAAVAQRASLLLSCLFLVSCTPQAAPTYRGTPQPRVDLVLESWGSMAPGDGVLVAEGAVTNVSARRIEGVTALIRFYDATGQIAFMETAYLDEATLAPGATTQFRLEILEGGDLDAQLDQHRPQSSSVVFQRSGGLPVSTLPRDVYERLLGDPRR